MSNNRILIIGIDGASFEFINPLIAAGKLPNIQKYIEKGASGPLQSTMPPICAPAWASFLTGKNPGKHGVYDFFEFKKNIYKKKVIDVNSIQSPTLPDILDKHKKNMIFMNIPIMFPPQRLNGVMVSGALTPPGKKCAYPESLSRELYRDDYIVDIAYDYIPNLTAFQRYVKQMTTKRFCTFSRLLEKYAWDLAVVDFVGAERLKQAVWEHPELINEIYIEYDKLIGKLCHQVGEDVSLIIMSDHGFTQVEKKFYVNEWLSELGFLAKEIKVGEPSIPEFIDVQFGEWRKSHLGTRDWFSRSRFSAEKVRSFIPTSLEMLLKKFTPFKVNQVFPREHLIIDWRNTQAYLSSRFSYAINVNLKGREPGGIVEPGAEYEEVRDGIIHELFRLKDPQTFQNVIDDVYKGEDLFWGPYISEAPDIVFIPRNFAYSIEPDKKTARSVISNGDDQALVLSAPHPEGVFIASGPEFSSGTHFQDLKIWDIAPIILQLLDVPIPKEMDGRIKSGLFRPDSVYANFETNFDHTEEGFMPDFTEKIHEPVFTPKKWEAWL